MDSLRSVAHLQKELGDDMFNALISSDNTGAVREFAKTLANVLPATITVGGRTYDLLGFLQVDKKSVKGRRTMVLRVKEMNANLGKEECEHLLKYQDDIPVALRGKVVFVFTDWHHPDGSVDVAYVDWDEGSQRWIQNWFWLGYGFDGCARVLRRK